MTPPGVRTIKRADFIELVNDYLDGEHVQRLTTEEERGMIRDAATRVEHLVTGHLRTEDEQCCLVGCAIPIPDPKISAHHYVQLNSAGMLFDMVVARHFGQQDHFEYEVVG